MHLKPLDFVVIAGIVLAALYPVVVSGLKVAVARLRRVAPATTLAGKEATTSQLRAKWVPTLMSLQSELESRPDQQAALTLCRQLMWQILGGGPTA